jgi:hypothetical protein
MTQQVSERKFYRQIPIEVRGREVAHTLVANMIASGCDLGPVMWVGSNKGHSFGRVEPLLLGHSLYGAGRVIRKMNPAEQYGGSYRTEGFVTSTGRILRGDDRDTAVEIGRRAADGSVFAANNRRIGKTDSVWAAAALLLLVPEGRKAAKQT